MLFSLLGIDKSVLDCNIQIFYSSKCQWHVVWGAFRTKWSLYVVFLPLFCKMNTLSGIKFFTEDSSMLNEILLLRYGNLNNCTERCAYQIDGKRVMVL